MDDLLDQILNIVELEEDKKDDFKKTFYSLLATKVVNVCLENDGDIAFALKNALQESEVTEAVKKILASIPPNSELNSKIEMEAKPMLSELVQDVSELATVEQKAKILDYVKENNLASSAPVNNSAL